MTFLVVLFLITNISLCSSFIWSLTDVLPANRILQFSERYMFASQEGPDLLDQGDSYIHVDMDVISYMEVNRTSQIGYAIYAVSEGHQLDTLLGICTNSRRQLEETINGNKYYGEDIRMNSWAANVYSSRVYTEYVDTVTVINGKPPLSLNGTFYRWKAVLDYKYPVQTEAWHNVAFELCDNEFSEPKAHVDGSITFRNPYGYLPAELYGFLPFEFSRMLAFFGFGTFYLIYYCRYRKDAIGLHKAILFVFMIALLESATWYIAYESLNETGTPYCCPFPRSIIAAFILQVIRQTFSRALLLVVSLGFGIVRPKLLPAEWISITLVCTFYLIAAIVAQVTEIVMVKSDVHTESPESVIMWQLPAMVLDVILLSWIYLALGSTIRILAEFKQTIKLKMYTNLARVITIFVGLFTCVTIIMLLDKSGVGTWPWQYQWLQQVLWEILNFGVLVAICIICLPSESSTMLSYASQLPTEDPDSEIDQFDDDVEYAEKLDNESEDEDEDEDDFGDLEMSDYNQLPSEREGKGSSTVNVLHFK